MSSSNQDESLVHSPKKALHESVKKGSELFKDTRLRVNFAIDSNAAITFMSLVTIYALYGDAVRLLVFDPDADKAFLVLSSLAFAIFLVEIALLCWCKEKYLQMPNCAAVRELCTSSNWKRRKSTPSWLGELLRASQTGSFYFWLDLMSTLSMAIEVCSITFKHLTHEHYNCPTSSLFCHTS